LFQLREETGSQKVVWRISSVEEDQVFPIRASSLVVPLARAGLLRCLWQRVVRESSTDWQQHSVVECFRLAMKPGRRLLRVEHWIFLEQQEKQILELARFHLRKYPFFQLQMGQPLSRLMLSALSS
jgi:hypothetical protein